MNLRYRPTTRLALALAAVGALSLGACADGGDPATDSGNLELLGMSLSADDDSDDGFDDADPEPFMEELDGEFPEDERERPSASELDGDDDAPARPDAILRPVLITWGQPVLNPDLETPSDWEGAIRSDVAFLKPLRKVRFDGEDRLIRDEDPHAVSFATRTLPHNDGVVIGLAVPKSADGAPVDGHLAFDTGKFQARVPLADVIDGIDRTVEVDDLGNVVTITTVQPHRCPHGLMRLRWERKNERGGIIGGQMIGPNGEVRYQAAGLWGEVEGKRRFKAFFMNAAGEKVGVLKGAYSPTDDCPGELDACDGVFRGVWVLTNREVGGVVSGVYRVGDEAGQGQALGRWHARCGDDGGPSCEADLTLPEAPAPDCSCVGSDSDDGEVCDCTTMPPRDTCVPPSGDGEGPTHDGPRPGSSDGGDDAGPSTEG